MKQNNVSAELGDLFFGFLASLPAALIGFATFAVPAMATMGSKATSTGVVALLVYLVLAAITFALCARKRMSLAVCNAVASVGWLIFFFRLG